MDLDVRDRVYLVTGASRGLGFAAAEALVAEGGRVVISARDEQGIQRATSALGTARAVGLAADNAQPTAPERLVATAMAKWGRLDGALVSVGGPPAGPAMAAADEDWRSAFESVFLGALRLVRAVAGACRDGGSVALVLSTSVRTPIPTLALSNGLRPGLAMVAKSMADELGPRGIRVNGLLPGTFETERGLQGLAAAPDPAAARAAKEETIPLRRLGDPREFGRVAAFLLSPMSSYVTGSMIAVDGGVMRAL